MIHEVNRFIADIGKINKTELSLVWLFAGNLHSSLKDDRASSY